MDLHTALPLAHDAPPPLRCIYMSWRWQLRHCICWHDSKETIETPHLHDFLTSASSARAPQVPGKDTTFLTRGALGAEVAVTNATQAPRLHTELQRSILALKCKYSCCPDLTCRAKLPPSTSPKPRQARMMVASPSLVKAGTVKAVAVARTGSKLVPGKETPFTLDLSSSYDLGGQL